MNYKYRSSIPNENIATELRYTINIKDTLSIKNVKYLINYFYTTHMLK